MGTFHIYLLVMFSSVVFARSCTNIRGGSSCTSRQIFGGILTRVKPASSLDLPSNKKIFLMLGTSTKFHNKGTSGKIVLRRGRPHCKANGNMVDWVTCPLEEEERCMAQNKTINENDCITTNGTTITETVTQTSTSTDTVSVTTDITDRWEIETGSRVRGFAYVTIQWKINTVMCDPLSQTLAVVYNDLEKCHEAKKLNDTKTFNEVSNSELMVTTFRGLQPHAKYHLTLTVQCTGVSKKYCKSEAIDTAESVPTAAPMNITSIGKMGKYLILQWMEPPCNETNGVITNYDFIFKKNGQQIHNLTPSDRKVVVFNGMNIGEPYSFKVRANTKRGFGIYSKWFEDTYRSTK